VYGNLICISASKRRRPVIREVEPKKRRRRYADSDLDDFLASSDEDNDEENNAGWRSEGDQSEYRSIPHTLHESVTTKAFVNLANLMLLTGPHASGKTSSVYAVAHELDWDVFEVNPSSKRNAKDLERSVGDVSKNHLVRKDASSTLSPTKKAPRGDIFSMMRAASGSRASHRPEAFKALPIAPSASSEQTTNPTKQSLILLDEVDVLFGDEENFWTGKLRACGRPIGQC
jgi:DNA polymerase III delta prime subunit